MFNQPPLILNLRGRKLIGRVAFAFLLLSSITFGTAAGLLFVYASDLPEIRALEDRSEEHTSELQSPCNLVCRLLLEKKKKSHRVPTLLLPCSPQHRLA